MNNALFIVIYILLCAVLIVVEIIVCKRARRHSGLVIPVISAIITLFLVLLFWQSNITISGGNNSVSVSTSFLYNLEEIRSISLLGGIPTILLFTIDLVHRQKKKRVNRELRKIDIDMVE